jgi:N-acetylmuramic acid 6-phosphate (MurNAc-6-P) etherase
MERPRTITEETSSLSAGLDVAGVPGGLRILRACDAQLLGGSGDLPGILDGCSLSSLAHVAGHMSGEAPTVVAFAGSGTSGRLAYVLARRLAAAAIPRVRAAYCCSGGDAALLVPQESAEDDARAGLRDLAAAVGGERALAAAARVVVVGISCGLSAAYVGGLLDWAQRSPPPPSPQRRVAVLLGFSPVDRASATAIAGWDRTFRDVARDVAAAGPKFAVALTPVVGPEALTGSTRMKGGSATWMLLLAAIDAAAHMASAASRLDSHAAAVDRLRSSLARFGLAVNRTYAALLADDGALFSSLVETAARALAGGGHLYYLARGALAPFALIDASECPPTFGASPHNVRAFVHGGWAALGNSEGDLSPCGPLYRIDADAEFFANIAPALAPCDAVVVVAEASVDGRRAASADATRLAALGHAPHVLLVYSCGRVDVVPPSAADRVAETCAECEECAARAADGSNLAPCIELAAKLALNALSTLAHVRCGKVYGNRMVDLRVSNVKLYNRAARIVADLGDVPLERAEELLLCAIYRGDPRPPCATAHDHVATAQRRQRVVPIALLLALLGSNATAADADAAAARLDRTPVVRDAVLEAAAAASARCTK